MGKTVPAVLSVSRLMDSSSTPLGNIASRKSVISTVTLFGSFGTLDFLTIKLTNALLESIEYQVNAGGNPITEIHTFSYQILEGTYRKLLPDNTLAAGISYTYKPVL